MVKADISRTGKTKAEFVEALTNHYRPLVQAEIQRCLKEKRKITSSRIMIDLTGSRPGIARWMQPLLEDIRDAQRKQTLDFAFQGDRSLSNEHKLKTWMPIVEQYLREKLQSGEKITADGLKRDLKARHPGFPSNLQINDATINHWYKSITQEIYNAIALQKSNKNHSEVEALPTQWEGGGELWRSRPLNSDEPVGKCPFTRELTTHAIEVRRGQRWVAKYKVSNKGLEIYHEKTAVKNTAAALH